MKKIIGWIIIIGGLLLILPNGYKWWTQSQLVSYNPKEAQKVAKDWDDLTPRPSLETGKKLTHSVSRGEKMGELIIPRLGAILPIVEGTDDNSLENGVGHYIGYGTVNPGDNGHVVLSGHRDTVFREVGKLKIGDRLYIRYQGHLFTYQIRKTWITHAEDRTVIVPYDRPILTLTTCYPFDYVGSAPDRYIIQSELIEIRNASQ